MMHGSPEVGLVPSSNSCLRIRSEIAGINDPKRSLNCAAPRECNPSSCSVTSRTVSGSGQIGSATHHLFKRFFRNMVLIDGVFSPDVHPPHNRRDSHYRQQQRCHCLPWFPMPRIHLNPLPQSTTGLVGKLPSGATLCITGWDDSQVAMIVTSSGAKRRAISPMQSGAVARRTPLRQAPNCPRM